MVDERLARRYATAILALADEAKRVDPIAESLTGIRDLINGDPQVADFLYTPTIHHTTKERILSTALDGRVEPIALQALLLIIRKRRERLFSAIVDAYHQLVLHQRGQAILRLTSARELSREVVVTIGQRLGAAYDTRFKVETSVDPRLLGGIRAQIDDRRLDASLAARLNRLAVTLLSHS